ncbi:MAG: NAD-dependent epimerase/dehydratase family protein [Pseudonocardiaceae bacterium]
MTSHVFITGVAGFLGSHLASLFVAEGCRVTGIDNLLGGDRANMPHEVEFRVADCCVRADYADLISGADVVFHCASAAYDGLSVFSPAFVHRNTAQATAEALSAAAAGGVGRFVHCSSMTRYGALPAPFTESMAPRPVTPYGIAKYTSELLVANVCSLHSVEHVIAVPHNIVGPRQRCDDPYRNVAAIMMHRMLKGFQPIVYGDGTQLRCFSVIDDVLFCLRRLGTDSHVVGEVFNIGPDEGAITVLGLAQQIADLLDFPLDPIFVPGRPQEVQAATCSADKARQQLGYRTTRSLRDGLSDMVTWMRGLGELREFQYDRPLEIVTDATPKTWTQQMM